jgi:hypothetical protein
MMQILKQLIFMRKLKNEGENRRKGEGVKMQLKKDIGADLQSGPMV